MEPLNDISESTTAGWLMSYGMIQLRLSTIEDSEQNPHDWYNSVGPQDLSMSPSL